MGLFKIFKKKEVPSELPDLATDEVDNSEGGKFEEDKEVVNDFLKKEEEEEDSIGSLQPDSLENFKADRASEKSQQTTNASPKTLQEEGFFNKFEESMNKELNDLNKLEKWYNNKFLPGDVVSDMRRYWEDQKPDSIVRIIGKDYQEKISKKTYELQVLEKEWQQIYFTLIEKEEKIKELEAELKKMLQEFIDLCKKKKAKKNGS